jgi:DNA-binding NtrC family response regulator
MSLPNSALAGRSVLIVEDEPLIALEVHAAFNAAGASIISAADTQEALRTGRGGVLRACHRQCHVPGIRRGMGQHCPSLQQRQ